MSCRHKAFCIDVMFFLWLPYVADANIIFSSCGYFLLLFSSPNLSRRRLDVYHTSTHDVALVGISNACLKCCQRYCMALEQRPSAKLCGVGMELRNFRRGRHLYSAGRPSRWASAHIIVISALKVLKIQSVKFARNNSQRSRNISWRSESSR